MDRIMQLIHSGRFYNSREWIEKRAEVLKRDKHECQRCKREGGFSPANTVHHIKHLKSRPDLALEDDNLESLCAPCHNLEHPERFPKPKVNEIAKRFPERW